MFSTFVLLDSRACLKHRKRHSRETARIEQGNAPHGRQQDTRGKDLHAAVSVFCAMDHSTGNNLPVRMLINTCRQCFADADWFSDVLSVYRRQVKMPTENRREK
jgi:hypothetical protein